MNAPKPKRVYSKYKAELEELTMYAKLSLELLGELRNRHGTDANSPRYDDIDEAFVEGQMATLTAVLARIDKKP